MYDNDIHSIYTVLRGPYSRTRFVALLFNQNSLSSASYDSFDQIDYTSIGIVIIICKGNTFDF